MIRLSFTCWQRSHLCRLRFRRRSFGLQLQKDGLVFAATLLLFKAFYFSAMESDPFHQNDELDKIPGLP